MKQVNSTYRNPKEYANNSCQTIIQLQGGLFNKELYDTFFNLNNSLIRMKSAKYVTFMTMIRDFVDKILDTCLLLNIKVITVKSSVYIL